MLTINHIESKLPCGWLVLFLVLFGFGLLQADDQDRESPYGPVDNGVPEGYKLFQGDIIVPLGDPDGGLVTNLWPNGFVPYVFSGNVPPNYQSLMEDAMMEWEERAHVNFIPRTSQDDYIFIQWATANNSHVGMQGGQQVVNIYSWTQHFVIVHELGHCLGMRHEQSRPDRDHYVLINWQNIEDGKEHNFEIDPDAYCYPKRDYGLSDSMTYDFDSVMHYSQYAFCKDPPGNLITIVVLPPNQHWQDKIGQKDHLSFLDKASIRCLYPYPGTYFLDKTHSGIFEWGTFFDPFKDFYTAMALVPGGGTLMIQPGVHTAVGFWNKPMTLDAPIGNVKLGY